MSQQATPPGALTASTSRIPTLSRSGNSSRLPSPPVSPAYSSPFTSNVAGLYGNVTSSGTWTAGMLSHARERLNSAGSYSSLSAPIRDPNNTFMTLTTNTTTTITTSTTNNNNNNYTAVHNTYSSTARADLPRADPSRSSYSGLARPPTPSSGSGPTAAAAAAAALRASAPESLLNAPPTPSVGAAFGGSVEAAGGGGGSGSSRSNIQVAVRVRPLCEKEQQRGDRVAWAADGEGGVGTVDAGGAFTPRHRFDTVFGPESDNSAVAAAVALPLVGPTLSGVNGTIFAYGVTSSGKTHTMMGTETDPGIAPRVVRELFSTITTLPGRCYSVRMSIMEIYNEVLNDLLDPARTNLKVREDARSGLVLVDGLVEHPVMSAEQALDLISRGDHNRKVSATAFNEDSSRSHTITRIIVESTPSPTPSPDSTAPQPSDTLPAPDAAARPVGRRTTACLSLIDLAGSESARAVVSKGQRMEGAFINRSLLTLGTVIHKLAAGATGHVPFRDSKLTRLLQPSLSGPGAKVAVVCNITPAAAQSDETANTLKFAARAKLVQVTARTNEILDERTLLRRYQKEVADLKAQLAEARRQMGAAAPGSSCKTAAVPGRGSGFGAVEAEATAAAALQAERDARREVEMEAMMLRIKLAKLQAFLEDSGVNVDDLFLSTCEPAPPLDLLSTPAAAAAAAAASSANPMTLLRCPLPPLCIPGVRRTSGSGSVTAGDAGIPTVVVTPLSSSRGGAVSNSGANTTTALRSMRQSSSASRLIVGDSGYVGAGAGGGGGSGGASYLEADSGSSVVGQPCGSYPGGGSGEVEVEEGGEVGGGAPWPVWSEEPVVDRAGRQIGSGGRPVPSLAGPPSLRPASGPGSTAVAASCPSTAELRAKVAAALSAGGAGAGGSGSNGVRSVSCSLSGSDLEMDEEWNEGIMAQIRDMITEARLCSPTRRSAASHTSATATGTTTTAPPMRRIPSISTPTIPLSATTTTAPAHPTGGSSGPLTGPGGRFNSTGSYTSGGGGGAAATATGVAASTCSLYRRSTTISTASSYGAGADVDLDLELQVLTADREVLHDQLLASEAANERLTAQVSDLRRQLGTYEHLTRQAASELAEIRRLKEAFQTRLQRENDALRTQLTQIGVPPSVPPTAAPAALMHGAVTTTMPQQQHPQPQHPQQSQQQLGRPPASTSAVSARISLVIPTGVSMSDAGAGAGSCCTTPQSSGTALPSRQNPRYGVQSMAAFGSPAVVAPISAARPASAPGGGPAVAGTTTPAPRGKVVSGTPTRAMPSAGGGGGGGVASRTCRSPATSPRVSTASSPRVSTSASASSVAGPSFPAVPPVPSRTTYPSVSQDKEPTPRETVAAAAVVMGGDALAVVQQQQQQPAGLMTAPAPQTVGKQVAWSEAAGGRVDVVSAAARLRQLESVVKSLIKDAQGSGSMRPGV